MIHFYETFLGEYDKKLKKARGVWYTPEPVVKFIVRAVDDILKSEFGLSQGLADTSKTKIQIKSAQGGDKRFKDGHKRIEKEVHKVQILDPATGTGTFLAEVVKHIHTKFKNQQGIRSGYVEDHLIPRLNGFEILMASYAMAHLKLDLLLTELGYRPTKQQRLKVFLTNSLEEHHPDTDTLFATWLASEANEANKVKRDTPVMVVLGNPPYSVSSSNKGVWINDLMEDYKRDLNERNIQPLSDDYIKFIRYGQHYIEKNGEGVLAYISNNSFIDGITHRQMRKYLLETFDEIYILDLHGNSKKKETALDGSKDENVFDIMQGVSINLFVKTGKKKAGELGKVYHSDLYGKRKAKYTYLNEHSMSMVDWQELAYREPYYFFIPKDFTLEKDYSKNINLNNLFILHKNGIETGRDKLFIDIRKKSLTSTLLNVKNNIDDIKIINDYSIKDSSDFKLLKNIKNIVLDLSHINKIHFRPFDFRYVYYDKNVLRRPSWEVIHHMLDDNIGLLIPRQVLNDFKHVFISRFITDGNLTATAKKYGSAQIFPLYLYPDEASLTQERTPNLDTTIVEKIAKGLDLTFSPEKSDEPNTFAPIDLLDYIYAVLHSPNYREKYKEFLKIDFPRVPYPTPETFWQLVEFGGKLRQVHLLESPEIEEYITSYPLDGDNTITRKIVKKDFEVTDENNGLGRVWINDEQYFDNVPVKAWEFYIGGYQPAQKWLKDRKERTLGFEDILHYQKIVKALMLTDQHMTEIDKVVSWE